MSQPHPHAVSQPPLTTTTPPAADASASIQNGSTAPARHATPTAPAPAAPAPAPNTTLTTFPPAAPTVDAPQTLNAQLNAADRDWKFKTGGYTLCLIVALIGTGCAGWATSTSFSAHSDFAYSPDSSWSIPWPLMTFGISAIWSAIVIATTLLRKRPVHPGARVSMDLLLWLGFIPTVLLALYSLVELRMWGSTGVIDSNYFGSSGRGEYTLSGNGVWVWDEDSSSSSSSGYYYARDCTRSSRWYDSGDAFASCAEQDAFLNALWAGKSHRVGVETTAVVCQFVGMVLHFALFVWACVDTNRRNRTKVTKDAEKIAAGIVEKMIQSGAIVRPPGQAYGMPPPPHMYQPPQQWHQAQGYAYAQGYPPMMLQQQQQEQGRMHPSPSAAVVPAGGPSSEKGNGPRYA